MPDLERNKKELSFGRRLARLGAAWRRQVDHDLRDYGLTEATWRPVLYLGLLPPPVRQTDLVRALEIEAPSVARLLDVLERRDLVFRSPDHEDKRSKLVSLTEKGERTARQVRHAVEAVSSRLLQGISTPELLACYSVFERIEANLCSRPAPPANAAPQP